MFSVVCNSKSDARLADVVYIAEGANEGVTKDPLRPETATAHVEERQSAKTLTNTKIDDVLIGWNREGSLSGSRINVEGKHWIAVNGVARKNIRSVICTVVAVECTGNASNLTMGRTDERSAGVRDGRLDSGARVASDGESLDVELPIGLGRQGRILDSVHLAVLGVDGAVGEQTANITVHISLHIEPNGKERCVEVWHEVLERRHDIVGGD